MFTKFYNFCVSYYKFLSCVWHWFFFVDVFCLLSDEIILGIFKYLTHEDLKYVAQVNHRFSQLAIDESLWPRIDLASKMLNPNSLAFIIKRGVKILRLKEATVSSTKTDTTYRSYSYSWRRFSCSTHVLDNWVTLELIT